MKRFVVAATWITDDISPSLLRTVLTFHREIETETEASREHVNEVEKNLPEYRVHSIVTSEVK